MSPRRTRYAVAATALAGLVLGLAPPSAQAAVAGTANPGVGETLRARSAPNTTAGIVTQYAHGAVLSIVCKATGTAVNGNTQWDKLANNAYVAHAFVSSSASIPACGTTPPPPPPAATPQGRVNLPATDNLKVRSTPSTSGAIVGQLTGGTTHTITCKTTGTAVNGTTQWDKIGSGYVSHAYITMTNTATIPTCATPPPPPPATSAAQRAISFAKAEATKTTVYTGGCAGNQRMGYTLTSAKIHYGSCMSPAQSNYYQPANTLGYDCSGLVVRMFKEAGINLAYGSSSQMKNYPAVSKSSLKPGDLLIKTGHVAVFIGNGQIVESTPHACGANISGARNCKGVRIMSSAAYLGSEFTAHRPPGV